MKTCIALLRGINIVGNRKLPMKDLVVLQRAGFDSVRTYIQSGKVVFRDAKGASQALSIRIAHLVQKRFGFQPHVMVLSDRELANAIRGNSFPKATDDPKSLHLFFLAELPAAPDLKSLADLRAGGEAFALKGEVFCLHTPAGFALSKLRDKVERYLGVHATARNWRTVNKLLEMARGGSAKHGYCAVTRGPAVADRTG